MATAPSAYPLQWPQGWPRTPAWKRQEAAFSTTRHNAPGTPGKPRALTVADALARLQQQLDLLQAKYCVVSSNIELRLDGMPRSGARMPDDPGVVAYFQLKGQPTTLPCDRYNRVADNIAAIAAHIDATRRIERYGVGTLAQMFTGFQAIRGPGPKPWREVLGFPTEAAPTAATIRAKVRELAMDHHPDRPGGDAGRMAEINTARDQAMQELSQ